MKKTVLAVCIVNHAFCENEVEHSDLSTPVTMLWEVFSKDVLEVQMRM